MTTPYTVIRSVPHTGLRIFNLSLHVGLEIEDKLGETETRSFFPFQFFITEQRWGIL